MNLKTILPLGLLLLIGCGDDGGTGPDSDQPPMVTIQEVLLEGPAKNNIRVIGTASDDKGLDSLRFSVNGFHQFTQPVTGPQTSFDMVAFFQPVGQGTVELIAFDNGGNSQTKTAPFEIEEPAPIIEGEVILVSDGEFTHPEGAQFCVEEVCGAVGSDGMVRLEGLPWKTSYQIHFIEGANPEILYVPNRNRFQKNLVNYTPVDARAGRVPLDTLLVAGNNTRRYIFFADSPVSLQSIVDNHMNVGDDWATRFLWLHGEGPEGRFGYPGEKHKFVAPGDTLIINIFRYNTTVAESTLDSLGAWASQAANLVQDCYAQIWDEPERYLLKVEKSDFGGLYLSPGYINLRPGDTNTQFIVEVFGEDLFKGTDIILSIQVHMNDPWGFRMVERQIKSGVTAVLIGLPRLADHTFGTYMSHVGEQGDLDTDWTTTCCVVSPVAG